ncbi:hypothetical protein [Methylomonas sp. LWB]|uniref:hypothetical protein n=1 Tax=Methylomonas sp. LWB TaxID=1905845 RepID=UPI0011154407|nr:hypothetical protein [Methylomonas sp. LWB]
MPSEPSGMGPPFFWILFFGGPKKSIAVVGPRTDIKTTVAPAIQEINTQPVYTKFRTPSSFNALSFTRKAFCLSFDARSHARKSFCVAFIARSLARKSFCFSFNAPSFTRKAFCLSFIARSLARKSFCVAFIARSLAPKSFCFAFIARSLARQSFCVAFAAGDSIDKTAGVVGPVSNRTAPVKRFE